MKFGKRSTDAALVVVAVVVAWATLHSGFFALSDDDYARVVIAEQFAHAPSLDPSGTSWLPFPFWLTGSAMWVLFRSFVVARAVALLSLVVAALLLRRAGTLLGLRDPGAFVAVFLPTSMTLAVSFQPETLTAGLVVFTAATTQVDGRQRVAGGFALAFATLSRYEAWPVAAAFASFGVFDAIRRRPGAAISAAVAVLGPIGWLLHGVARHGDPLFFVRRVTAYRSALGNGESWLAALAAYPYAFFRAEPMLAGLMVIAAVLWLRGSVRTPAVRRFLLVLGTLCVFLLSGRLMDGAPTHHDERPLLPIFWAVALLAADAVARAVAAMDRRSALRAIAATGIALGVLGSSVHHYLPGDSSAPRADERALGESARKMTPGAFLVVDTPDYGYFAVIAAFGAPERAAPLMRHDPRDPTKAALSSPEAVAAALRASCPAPSPSCAYVVHETHRGAASALGTVALTHRAFALIRGADP